MKKLTIIIPVYNAEKFIDACLSGIVEQDNGNIEVILIDDGSIDRSAEICRKYVLEYPYVYYYYKENGGVSSARNFGLQYATGDYVWFVDIDDEIETGAIAQFFSGSTAQLMIYNFSLVENGAEKKIYLQENNFREDVSAKDNFLNEYVFTYKLNNALWNKVFCLDIIKENNIRFDEKIKIGEDFLFTLLYYRFIQDIYFSTASIYRYYIRESGAMKSKNPMVFQYQQKIASVVKSEYMDILSPETMQQFLLMQLVCGINQSKERGVDKKQIKIYVKNYMEEIMCGKRFSRAVVNNFLKTEGAGFLSKIKFKIIYAKVCE